MTNRNYNVIETEDMCAEELQTILNDRADCFFEIDCAVGTKIVMSAPSMMRSAVKTTEEKVADSLKGIELNLLAQTFRSAT
ncbi:hypothetical protein HCI99_06185 [Listeria booriae]|uniref:Uncharacterized protein n=1 Tax=Listeria booriae TaxID=1552123 RepID=A0A7X0XC00_9LIST|nr:hypothetical protein [Listeria booriae]MBC1491410.1 hypothetical protein [Listeria booriae]